MSSSQLGNRVGKKLNEINIKYSHILQESAMQYGVDQYYVILSHLSTYFNNSIIVDLGTLTGGSAQALAYNQSNTVYTYDILEDGTAIQRFARVECENIKYIIGDCIRDNWAGMVMLDGVPPMSDKKIFL